MVPRIRSIPEDFIVEEVPAEEPEGHGEHTYLWVEKRLMTTDQVWRELARWSGTKPSQIGYAGRKDRRAVTRQWFSVPHLEPAAALNFEAAGLRVLEAHRHPRKLRLGQLLGNRFQIRVRQVAAADAERLPGRLMALAQRGMPNRYGPQRFGRDGQNAHRGAEILRGEGRRMNRRQAWFLISALQSAVFNEVLTRRPYDRLLPGDLGWVHATGDLVPVPQPYLQTERLERFEISPTGPIFGTKMRRPTGEVAELEAAAMAAHQVQDPREMRLPRWIRLYGDRRPLRVQPRHTSAATEGDGVVRLAFELPAGSYGTVLLEELFPMGIEEGEA